MDITCERDALFSALNSCADLCRIFSEAVHVTLTAYSSEGNSPGYLDVCWWEMISGIGIVAQVPAEVAEAGSVTVPTRMVARILKNGFDGFLHLSSILVPDPVPVSDDELIKPIKGGPALQIEGTSSTGSRQSTRLRLIASTTESAVSQVLAAWQARGVPLASVKSSALRETLAPCLFLAKEREVTVGETRTMDHALILFRFDPQALVCTATTQSAVAQRQLAWVRSSAILPCTHLLVDGRALRWITTVLKSASSMVTLTLVPQEPPEMLFLFSFSDQTLICRGKTAPIPEEWEQRVEDSSACILLLSRLLLTKALGLLSAGRAGNNDRLILLHVRDGKLWLQWDPSACGNQMVTCQIPLLNTVDDQAPVLLSLQQIRRILRFSQTPAISLELGTIFVRQKHGESKPTDFVRFSTPDNRSLRVMLTAREYSPSSAHQKQNSASATEVLQAPSEKEASLANV